jgi:hypothetical protein
MLEKLVTRISKRFADLMVVTAIWASTGFIMGQWDVFTNMTIPMIGLHTAYIAGETIRKSDTHKGGGE